MNKNLLLLLVMLACLPISLVASVIKLVEQMGDAGKVKASEVVEKSKAEASLLLRELAESERFLREDIKKQGERAVSKVLAKTEELLADAHEEALDFSRNAYEHVERLKQRTAEAVDTLIQQAEEDALKIKAAQRKKIMQEFLDDSALRQKKAWKEGLREEFFANMDTIERIVKEGETAEEVPHFLETFKKQRAWFATTLDGIKRSSDQRYFLLYQKAHALKNIVQAYHKVSEFLIAKIKLHGINAPDMAKPRLLALYDVQARVMKNKSMVEAGGQPGPTFLTETDCQIIADILCNKLFAKEQKEAAAVVKKDLALRNAQLEITRDLAKKEELELKQAVKNVQQESSKQVSSMADQIAKKVEDATLRKMNPIVEGLNKDKAELEIVVREQKSTIERIGKEMQARANDSIQKGVNKNNDISSPKFQESNKKKAIDQERINRASLEEELRSRQPAVGATS
jgi:hypothetical protein